MALHAMTATRSAGQIVAAWTMKEHGYEGRGLSYEEGHS